MEKDESVIEFRLGEFMKFLKQRTWRSVFLTILIVALTVVPTHLVTKYVIRPNYQSESMILIEGQSSEVMIKNYREILTSRKVLKQAIIDSGKTWVSVDALSKHIKVVGEGNANFLTVYVNDEDPETARELNQAIIEEFVHVAQPLVMGTKELELSVFDTASLPSEPTNKNYLKNDGLAAGVAFCVSLMILYCTFLAKNAKEWTRRRIQAEVKEKALKKTSHHEEKEKKNEKDDNLSSYIKYIESENVRIAKSVDDIQKKVAMIEEKTKSEPKKTSRKAKATKTVAKE